MNREERIVNLKLDIIFKRVFGNEKNTDIIAAFISDLLEIPRSSIKEIYINNVELAPEYLDQKFSRLDLKLNVDDKIVNIEMQVSREPYFNDRTLYYWSKMYSDELKSGEEYGELKQTICINIINFNQFDCEDYHSHFKVLEKERQEVLSDKFAIHFFELKKIKNAAKHKRMEDWLNLINAETEGDLMEIQSKTTIPEVQKTIVMLRELSADEKLRQEVYYREKRLHDEATALNGARREGMEEGIAIGQERGIAIGQERGIAIGQERGIAIGQERGRVEGRAEFAYEMIERMRNMGMSEEEIRKIMPLE